MGLISLDTFPMTVDYVNLFFFFSFYSISLNLQFIVISLDENLILLFVYVKQLFQFRKKNWLYRNCEFNLVCSRFVQMKPILR